MNSQYLEWITRNMNPEQREAYLKKREQRMANRKLHLENPEAYRKLRIDYAKQYKTDHAKPIIIKAPKEKLKPLIVRLKDVDTIGYLLLASKNSAKQRMLEFSLVREDIVIPEKCPYFDITFSFENRKTYPSVDRINPDKGYTKDNIQIVSYMANICRSALSIEETKKLAVNIINIYEKNILPDSELMMSSFKSNSELLFYSSRINRLFGRLKRRAKQKNLEFNLTRNDLLIPKYCPYLGIELKFKDLWNSPTVDRIDNSKGYVKGNIQILSYQANTCKNTLSVKELLVFANNALRLHK